MSSPMGRMNEACVCPECLEIFCLCGSEDGAGDVPGAAGLFYDGRCRAPALLLSGRHGGTYAVNGKYAEAGEQRCPRCGK